MGGGGNSFFFPVAFTNAFLARRVMFTLFCLFTTFGFNPLSGKGWLMRPVGCVACAEMGEGVCDLAVCFEELRGLN